ncbi:MAG TPA: NAD(P)-dependent oxidoreductase [Candidatus Binatia bacterium]|nr:NAD(P)-dependent oxidoreductase [Candidatus Binatia bacterium]
MASVRPIIVVEDDRFLRLVQIILDPATPTERFSAFTHFMAHDEPDFKGWCQRLRARLGKLYPAEVRLVADQGDLHSSLLGAHVAIVESFPMGEKEILAAGGSVQIVQKYGTIATRIDADACQRLGARLLTIRRRANIATAEHAFALILALARRITDTANLISVTQLRSAGYSPTHFDRSQTPNGNWARINRLRTLYQQQLGVMGFGEIGREVAYRAVAFGMRVVYWQRHRLDRDEEDRYQVNYCSLDELLATSDCISLHMPGGEGTRGIIGRRELGMIKPGALLINVSQPQLIDRAALIQALAAGRLSGFGLDTFYDEPGQAHDPLLGFRNVLITPHLAGSPRFNALRDFEEMLMNIDQVLRL